MRKRSSIARDRSGVVHKVRFRPDTARLGLTHCDREYVTVACKRKDIDLIRRAKPSLLTVSYVDRQVDCLDCLGWTEDE